MPRISDFCYSTYIFFLFKTHTRASFFCLLAVYSFPQNWVNTDLLVVFEARYQLMFKEAKFLGTR